MKKFALAFVFTLVAVSFVMGDDFIAVITKIDGKTVYYKGKGAVKGEGGTDGKADLADKVKVNQGTAKKGEVTVGDVIEKGVKDDVLAKIDMEKGQKAQIKTNDKGLITDIVVLKGGGGAGKKKGG